MFTCASYCSVEFVHDLFVSTVEVMQSIFISSHCECNIQ